MRKEQMLIIIKNEKKENHGNFFNFAYKEYLEKLYEHIDKIDSTFIEHEDCLNHFNKIYCESESKKPLKIPKTLSNSTKEMLCKQNIELINKQINESYNRIIKRIEEEIKKEQYIKNIILEKINNQELKEFANAIIDYIDYTKEEILKGLKD